MPPSLTPHSLTPGARARFLWAGGVSVVAWVLLQLLAPGPALPWTDTPRAAAEGMARATEAVARYCAGRGIPVDPAVDPNGTCLVGPELTELFTTLGQLEAKRTTTHPDWAGLLVHLLHQAGVSAGDTVAVGASGSFPALTVATLMAVEALGAHPVTLLSLGASSYGATRPDFHLLDLVELLRSQGHLVTPVTGVSLGGGDDVGGNFEPAFRTALEEEVRVGGFPLLDEADLGRNVARRMALYGSPAVFVNVGGSDANLGLSPLILKVPPGLSRGEELELPAAEERGVLFAMAARGVPVIHLLHVRGLVLRYGLPWDPVPLPGPGTTDLRDAHESRGWGFWLVTAMYAAALAVVGAAGWKGGRRSRSGRPYPSRLAR